ncbi:MAG: type II secretion system protein [Phycisphaerae bacterium]|nr:type II secretion system protein [Phycisphaerae bacterium]
MKKKGFTLIELMVVILIVGILAAASIPLMRGRIDSAKWAEANAIAGTIQSAGRVYFAEYGTIATTTTMTELGFNSGDLTGTYFVAGDFSITAVDTSTGRVEVTVTGSTSKAPSGTYKMETDGDWVKQ